MHRILITKRGVRIAILNLNPDNDGDLALLVSEGIVFNDNGIFVNQGDQIWTFADIEKQLDGGADPGRIDRGRHCFQRDGYLHELLKTKIG
jgi:hypothetical protein